jgi:hypothetical protein
MRILFIDFDGVLHATAGPPAAMKQFVWLPILLDLISGQADFGLVVHASARQQSTADFLMCRMGLTPPLWQGVTEPALQRWPSIQHWLTTHPETTSYRILDDMASEFPSPMPPELILCNPQNGLSDHTVQNQIRKWLSPVQ